MHQPQIGTSTSFPHRLWTVSWKLVLFVGVFLVLYIPFVLPYFKFPQTEYVTVATAFGRTQIEFLAMITVLLAALAMTRYVDRMPLSSLGFSSRGLLKEFAAGSFFGAILMLVILGALALNGYVSTGAGMGVFDSEFFWTSVALLINTIGQETVVHGYVQQMVRAKFGSAAGVIVSSFLLVVLHWTLFQADALLLLTNLFAAGVLLGLCFLCSRSLWLPIGLHFGWNYIQGPILGLPLTGVDIWPSDLVKVQGPDLLTGGKMGIEGGVFASIALVGASVWAYRKWRANLLANPDLERAFP